MVGSELRNSIKIKDASRAKFHLENKIELSEDIFPRIFCDGGTIFFRLEDITPMRLDVQEIFQGLEGKIFYSQQDTPIIITLGTTYQRGDVRKGLNYLRKILEEDCGTYIFKVEKTLPSVQKV